MDLIKRVRIDQVDKAINTLYGKWPGLGKHDTLGHAAGICFSFDGRSAPISPLCTRADFEARKAERQKKPGWKDAPEWAQWLAQDCSGQWRFYTDEPQVIPSSFIVPGAFRAVVGRFIRFTSGEVIGDWRDTLEQRPNHIVEPDEKAEPKLAELVDWYDYEALSMRKNALPPAGEICECFDHERNEFVRVKVLDAPTHSREIAVAVIYGNSFSKVFWGCDFRPLDWDRNQQPKPEPDLSPELSFHLSNAFNELQAGARLLPEDDPRKQMLVSLANGVSVVREGV